MKISYSFGILDLFHYGHLKALKEAQSGSDLHIFGLVSDEAANSWLGKIVSNYYERYRVIEDLQCVDEVMYQETLDPLDNLKFLHAKYPYSEITLFHGDDWKILPAEDFLKAIGGSIRLTDYYEKLSPENILKILNDKNHNQIGRNDIISTKANTLLALKKYLKKSKVEETLVLTRHEYMLLSDNKLREKLTHFQEDSLVIRSSSSNEDAFQASNAGHYNSYLNIDAGKITEVRNAIEGVLGSYSRDNLNHENEQVLIQSQTSNVSISGVVFTKDIKNNRPYYLINYDSNGSTEAVTSGMHSDVVYIARSTNIDNIPSPWQSLIESVLEIESLLPTMILDIEFAVKENNEIVIFQARPLAANYKYLKSSDDQTFHALIDDVINKYFKLESLTDQEYMYLSDMAFWNPSEIIGSNPRTLDYSLYREIITEKSWNDGLIPLGYTRVDKEIMFQLGNKPYISLDYSFLSLIPESTPFNIKHKLINRYKKVLKKDRTTHDKIEFEIVYSLYTFDTSEHINQLKEHSFNDEEIETLKSNLFRLTNEAIKMYFDTLDKDKKDLNKLNDILDKIATSNEFTDIRDVYRNIESIKILFDAITRYGTPQFSRQARYGFIAKAFIDSMKRLEIVPESDLNVFLNSIRTVASDFESDFNALSKGKIDSETFFKRYGHLRSGTYDIRAKRYDQQNFFQDSSSKTIKVDKRESTETIKKRLNKITVEEQIQKHEFGFDAEHLFNFLEKATQNREYFKFEFTKVLSRAIELIATTGTMLGFQRKEMSYLSISDIYSALNYKSENELINFWKSLIVMRKSQYYDKSKLILPEVACTPYDFEFIQRFDSRPNFIANHKTENECVFLEIYPNTNITGKIVIINKADPGFDWIFAQNITGLVTKYGGAASHMAIRCAEFDIPAAIGVGEKIFDQLSNARKVLIDPKNYILKEVL